MKNSSRIRTDTQSTSLKILCNLSKIEVLGLFTGSRGTTNYFINFCKQFNLRKSLCKEIAVLTLKSSIQIIFGATSGWRQIFRTRIFCIVS